jgi:excinuclease ABC subunit B
LKTSGKVRNVTHNISAILKSLNENMHAAAADLEFEEAARLRDEIRRLEATELGLTKPGVAPKAAWKHSKKSRKGKR